MRKLLLLLCIAGITFSMYAQDLSTIKLKSPDITRGTGVMKALSDRQSVREYSDKMLSDQDLADLLWAANGINRPDGKRTAPSAMNKQDVDVYVFMKQGVYLYDHTQHALKPVAKGDYRGAVAAGQDFVKEAPVSLVLVTDLSRFGSEIKEHTKLMGAVDVGIVNQNINLACVVLGLVTVPRATMDQKVLRELLKLNENQLLLMNNPVGYPK
ncbi:MAG: SagB/ThcOx family dehydrogenase [Tannerellaceae bacterium]|nr:SagB/ThcOx family dehydrogenase [Tannerellaceae bacterium]